VVAVASGIGNGVRRDGDGPILAKNAVTKIRRYQMPKNMDLTNKQKQYIVERFVHGGHSWTK